MALGTDLRGTEDFLGESVCDLCKDQLNNLQTRFDALLAKLDADATVTDTDYGATLDDGLALVKGRFEA